MKQVKILGCTDTLPVIKAMKDVTGYTTETCRNITHSICNRGSVLLLDAGSITVSQWEQIVARCEDNLNWEYLSSLKTYCESKD
jgi:hypothetical protein